MSCVLANRVVLNVRKYNRNSRIYTKDDELLYDDTGTSFCTPGKLSVYEMGELRAMRAETKFSVIEEGAEGGGVI